MMAVMEAYMRIVMALCVVVGLGHVTPAGAQELATSFNQLRVLVKTGDTLTVTDSDGRELRGEVATLSVTSLDMIINGQSRALQESQVLTIRLKRADTLANGAKIGFGIGLAFGVIGGLAISDEFGLGAIPLLALPYGALGAGIGVGVDALSVSTNVIFSQPSGRTVTLKVAPIVGSHATGVRVALGF